ncbi:MAG: hemolysin family protein [Gammaproteobacteria bacterium]|nr:hemolysin family protein [Gammaproteobacteria bacterium]
MPALSAADLLAPDAAALLTPEIVVRGLLMVALFVASAFFSGSETALFSLSRLDLRRLRRERHPLAGTLHALLDQPRRLIISILCGNQVVNVVATANLTAMLVLLYGVEKAAWVSLIVMVPLLLLFGEATPKTIAVSDPVGISTRIVARPINFWVNTISPLSNALRFVADRITTAIVGEPTDAENILQVDEFRTLLDEGVVRGELTATERALIQNLLRAGVAEIVEVMVPRTRVNWLDGDLPLDEIVERFLAYRHNRVPVYRGQRDNVVGFLCAEDVRDYLLDGDRDNTLSVDELLRPPVMVPPTKKIDEMFDYFQSKDLQAVIVLNEFGGVDGLLTLNDVLTCIFGRSQAEGEQPGFSWSEADQAYEVPGAMKLMDFNRLTNLGLDDQRMTTIGGVVLRHLDRLPAVGDRVAIDEVSIEVVAMDGNRIDQVRVCTRPARHG